MIRNQRWQLSHSIRGVAGMLLALAFWSSNSAGTPLVDLPGLSNSVERWLSEPRSEFSAPALANPAQAEFWLPGPELDPDSYFGRFPFGSEIASAAARHDLDPLLLISVVEVESNFQPHAVSPKGAMGLMQVMPVHVEDGVEPFDPEVNLELGAAFLSSLKDRFGGDLALTIAAYHAGAGAVERFDGMPPYSSTRSYVEKVLETYRDHYRALTLPVAAAGPVRQVASAT